MHISEGILSPGVLIAGAGLTAAGVAIGLRKLEIEEIPSVGILSAVKPELLGENHVAECIRGA
ncbi:MAG: energy-coupling factor ABC transporter permease [Deltaproteobacteria bacterium]|nr:energy-coupling factor ABC transporter permease [Deltaproteobacteria bacterium]MBW2330767.1 energy-coupling factor ABC transporter permease [Deltaproteobacteria bacterium]